MQYELLINLTSLIGRVKRVRNTYIALNREWIGRVCNIYLWQWINQLKSKLNKTKKKQEKPKKNKKKQKKTSKQVEAASS